MPGIQQAQTAIGCVAIGATALMVLADAIPGIDVQHIRRAMPNRGKLAERNQVEMGMRHRLAGDAVLPRQDGFPCDSFEEANEVCCQGVQLHV